MHVWSTLFTTADTIVVDVVVLLLLLLYGAIVVAAYSLGTVEVGSCIIPYRKNDKIQ